MGDHIATLIKDETWEMVLCPDGVKTFGCMWVDSRENWSGGIEDRSITWLEVKGFNQQYELHFDETFDLVTKITTI